MAIASFYNMKLLCYIDDTDFTDYQGIGSDPMYKRFDSVFSVIKNNIDEKYQGFLARPYYDDGIINWYVNNWKETPRSFKELCDADKVKYSNIKNDTLAHYKERMQKMRSEEHAILFNALKYINDDFIYCYDDKVVLVAWGMRPDTTKHQTGGSWIKSYKIEKQFKIHFDAGNHGHLTSPTGKTLIRKKGYQITEKDLPEIVAENGYIFQSWEPNPIDYEVKSDNTFVAKYTEIVTTTPSSIDSENIKVTFDAGLHGILQDNQTADYPKGYVLSASDIPTIIPDQGFCFSKWNPAIDTPLKQDTSFVAEYTQQECTCHFMPGNFGDIIGNSILKKPLGSHILGSDIPQIKAKKGYKFVGWDSSPLGTLNNDRTFTAQYEKVSTPWYHNFLSWFNGKGCLNWLIGLLLLILLFWFLNWILRGCSENLTHKNPVSTDTTIIGPIDKITDDNGKVRDDNGTVSDIIDENGKLPKEPITAPISEGNGNLPVIIHNEGLPDVIANRLNIYFENENANLDQWAKDFKKAYPSEEYKIIGYDENVRLIQIQIPEKQRDIVREEISKKIPDQKIFVVDESIIDLHGQKSKSPDISQIGWHIKATNMEQAWNITKGNTEVVVAIVDDGIDATHSMFEGRFYKAYNVFTKNSNLSCGSGHGTHVAGLAAGSTDFISKGAAGVAPKCKIMPIQVFDNDLCTFSSIASGIMYAIHNGADVVNISIGPSFRGLDQLPISEQQEISQSYFKNEERVYRHIMTAVLPECRLTKRTLNVAAVAPNLKAADFTNYSLGANISAPGVNINSSYPINSFKMLDGTSMSAPIIAGTVALMRSIKKDITIEQVLYSLNNSGKEIDNYIPKMVQIDQALEIVKTGNFPKEKSNKQEIIDNDSSGTNQNDYAKLRKELEDLKSQRDQLNEKIKDIEKQLN